MTQLPSEDRDRASRGDGVLLRTGSGRAQLSSSRPGAQPSTILCLKPVEKSPRGAERLRAGMKGYCGHSFPVTKALGRAQHRQCARGSIDSPDSTGARARRPARGQRPPHKVWTASVLASSERREGGGEAGRTPALFAPDSEPSKDCSLELRRGRW